MYAELTSRGFGVVLALSDTVRNASLPVTIVTLGWTTLPLLIAAKETRSLERRITMHNRRNQLRAAPSRSPIASLAMILVFVLASTDGPGATSEAKPAPGSAECQEYQKQRGIERSRAMMGFQAGDPTIVAPAIKKLCELMTTPDLMLVHYRWIASTNPQIRKTILEEFWKLSSDPADYDRLGIVFHDKHLTEWIGASLRFSSPEKERRLEELKAYFPEAANLIADSIPKDQTHQQWLLSRMAEARSIQPEAKQSELLKVFIPAGAPKQYEDYVDRPDPYKLRSCAYIRVDVTLDRDLLVRNVSQPYLADLEPIKDEPGVD